MYRTVRKQLADIPLFPCGKKGKTVKIARIALSVMAAFVLLSLAAQAEVKVEMKAEKVSVQDGKEVMSPAKQAAPGDIVQYTAVYKNTDKSPATQVFATVPIPAGTDYVSGTAVPAGATASTDGTHFSAIPLKRKVKNSEGKLVEQDVPFSEYRALRWSLGDLAGGESRTVSARVKVRK
jgi:uncharacterized repeat protein (TIGR01451 family)